MKPIVRLFPVLSFVVVAALSGCTGRPAEPPKVAATTPSQADDAATLRANLEKLPAEDRKLAEEQGYCAVEIKNRLGSMGVPVKVMVNDQPVFLCCDACETKAKAHADRTLARVKQLREKGTEPPATK